MTPAKPSASAPSAAASPSAPPSSKWCNLTALEWRYRTNTFRKCHTVTKGDYLLRQNRTADRIGLIILGTIILLMIVDLLTDATKSELPNGTSPKVSVTPSEEYRVTYKVDDLDEAKDSMRFAHVTLRTPDGTEQHRAFLPWQRSYSFTRGDTAFLMAQRDEQFGLIAVEIYLNDRLIKRAWSSGAYSVATTNFRVQNVQP